MLRADRPPSGLNHRHEGAQHPSDQFSATATHLPFEKVAFEARLFEE